MAALVGFFSYLLNIFYNFTSSIGFPNYGLAIILLTIIIKTILFPLTYKQMASMRKMADLNPKIKELQTKYKAQPEKANAEVMKLYQEHKVNPLSGCLPLVIQMPVFIGLYRTLATPGIFRHNPMFLGVNLTITHNIIFAVLAAITTFLQSKFSGTNPNDPTFKTMLYVMPVFLAYISYTVPAGLALYWVVMNTMSILQQLWINKRIGKLAVQKA
ncbi:MAG: YidC/Oxa1 family membrane protein insertase [Peptococcaceae bacterium]|nr:YidC/Oxa1 family membrane protein insertase [Peptococcaceae bacterium]